MQLERMYQDKPYGAVTDRPGLAAILLEGKRGRLFSRLYKAGGEGPHPAVLLLHGFPGHEQNLDLAQTLRRVGFHVLMMHYSGTWGSDGDFSFEHALEDAETAFAYLTRADVQQEHGIDGEHLFVVGHSMGGFIAFHTAAKMKAAKAAVMIAPYDFGLSAVLAEQDETAKETLCKLLEGGIPWLSGTSKEALYAELQAHGRAYQVENVKEALAAKPILVIGATLDEVAVTGVYCEPIVERIRTCGRGLVEYETMETDHAFSDMRLKLSERIAHWLADKVTNVVK